MLNMLFRSDICLKFVHNNCFYVDILYKVCFSVFSSIIKFGVSCAWNIFSLKTVLRVAVK